MKRILHCLFAAFSLGCAFAVDPQIALDFEGLDRDGEVQAEGTWGIRFKGKDFLSRDAKSGEYSLGGNLYSVDKEEGTLAKEYTSLTTAAWVKIDPTFKSGALFIRLVGGDKVDGAGRMKALLRSDGADHYCVTFTVHAVGEQDEKTFTSDRVELPVTPEWVYIAIVFSQGEISFYRDGDLISRASTDLETIPALRGDPVFYVGGGITLDNWTFFDRALESEEIREYMNKH